MKLLLTRPQPSNNALIPQLEQAGIYYVSMPCIKINLPKDITAFNNEIKLLPQKNIVIFTSINAVKAITAKADLNSCEKIIAIGPSTAESLKEITNQKIIKPQSYDSEGVLELLCEQQVNKKSIAIITGESPRPLLTDTLTKRGALVTEIYAYQRTSIEYDEKTISSIVKDNITHILCISQKTIKQLNKIFIEHHNWLHKKHILVSSTKQSKFAEHIGFQNISILDEINIENIKDYANI